VIVDVPVTHMTVVCAFDTLYVGVLLSLSGTRLTERMDGFQNIERGRTSHCTHNEIGIPASNSL